MAVDNLVEAGFEGGNIQVSADAYDPADIVNRALRLQLFQKPQSFLGERQRRSFAGFSGYNRRRQKLLRAVISAEELEQFLFTLGNLCTQIFVEHTFGSVQAQTLAFGA